MAWYLPEGDYKQEICDHVSEESIIMLTQHQE
jgi:hypothetical protein